MEAIKRTKIVDVLKKRKLFGTTVNVKRNGSVPAVVVNG